MARVGQFKALGSALGGYKKTLADVQSKDYAKKYADVRAQEQVSLYNEIGGTVANIIGISQEMKELKKLKPLDKPDRPNVPTESQAPDALSDSDMPSAMQEIDMSNKSLDGPNPFGKIDPPPSEQMPRGGVMSAENEYRPTSRKNFDENIPTKKASMTTDDKAFNAMNTYETGIGPNVGQKAGVSDIMKATESQGFFDSSTGQFTKEASPSSTPTGESFAGGHSGGKVYRDNEDFTRTQMGEIRGLFGGRELEKGLMLLDNMNL